jgi:hypothetical protein
MAIVRKLILQQLETDSRHSEADCTYSIVAAPDATYLQIDTYGSRQRQIPGKKSQSIRLAPEAIEQLKSILRKHFT